MNVLVVNAGSSSLKYQLIKVETHDVLAKGICERIGDPAAFHKHGLGDNEVVDNIPIDTHVDAINMVLEALVSGDTKAIDSLAEIGAIGHRVVQGGNYFAQSVLIDDDVIEKIDELAELAPLHNKAALMGIHACQQLMPDIPMVAVFDTSFFQTLPEEAYRYPIPYELSEKYNIRKYGAHGTSHRYLAERAASMMSEDPQDVKIITCHLGNGASVTAVDHGKAVDTSMGMTPLDGLMMGTRSGTIDPAIVTFLMEHEGMTPAEINEMLNKKSGLLGVTGKSNDLREIDEYAMQRDERCLLAYDMYANGVKKFIGQYMALMGGVDAIVLSAGVGENSKKMRRKIFSGLQPLGIILNTKRNGEGKGEREISSEKSEVRIFVIPTNEEYMIARDTYEIVHKDKVMGAFDDEFDW